MKLLILRLWNDDHGFIVSSEAVFLFTIAVVGLVIGWVHLRNAVVSESTDIANAFQTLDQSYFFVGLQSSCDSGAIVGGANLIDPNTLTETLDVFMAFPGPDVIVSEAEPCIE